MTGADQNRPRGPLPSSGIGMPPFRLVAESDRQACIAFDVTGDLCWFRGHFPAYPVLPGVVQLHWAVLFSRALFGFAGTPPEIKRLKFKKVVIPPRELELVISLHQRNEAHFTFSSPLLQHSEGRLVFSAAAP